MYWYIAEPLTLQLHPTLLATLPVLQSGPRPAGASPQASPPPCLPPPLASGIWKWAEQFQGWLPARTSQPLWGLAPAHIPHGSLPHRAEMWLWVKLGCHGIPHIELSHQGSDYPGLRDSCLGFCCVITAKLFSLSGPNFLINKMRWIFLCPSLRMSSVSTCLTPPDYPCNKDRFNVHNTNRKAKPKTSTKTDCSEGAVCDSLLVNFLCKPIVVFGQRLVFNKCTPPFSHKHTPALLCVQQPPWSWESRMSSQKTAACPPGVAFPEESAMLSAVERDRRGAWTSG